MPATLEQAAEAIRDLVRGDASKRIKIDDVRRWLAAVEDSTSDEDEVRALVQQLSPMQRMFVLDVELPKPVMPSTLARAAPSLPRSITVSLTFALETSGADGTTRVSVTRCTHSPISSAATCPIDVTWRAAPSGALGEAHRIAALASGALINEIVLSLHKL